MHEGVEVDVVGSGHGFGADADVVDAVQGFASDVVPAVVAGAEGGGFVGEMSAVEAARGIPAAAVHPVDGLAEEEPVFACDESVIARLAPVQEGCPEDVEDAVLLVFSAVGMDELGKHAALGKAVAAGVAGVGEKKVAKLLQAMGPAGRRAARRGENGVADPAEVVDGFD